MFKIQGIFITLSSIYDTECYSESRVNVAYLEPWYNQNPRHIQNAGKNLL